MVDCTVFQHKTNANIPLTELEQTKRNTHARLVRAGRQIHVELVVFEPHAKFISDGTALALPSRSVVCLFTLYVHCTCCVLKARKMVNEVEEE